jgi:sialate O-acetylesterase
MPAVFSDHMVLQRDCKIPVWGWADPGEKVTVKFKWRRVKTRADATGKWRVTLKKSRATAKPQVLVVKGTNTLTFKDVLVGDVWICSGQSNMAMPVSNCINAEAEIKAADLPQIRQFKVRNTILTAAEDDVIGDWQLATPSTVGGWTAAGYFFGRDLHRHLNVPIGLINTSWGGTRVEAWISREKLATLPETQGDLKQLDNLETNYEQVQKLYRKSMEGFLGDYRKLEALETDTAHQKRYSAPGLDDSAWEQIMTPANWESAGHPGLDGEAWYRRSVEIPAGWAGQDLALELGPIDEIDTTYFNGEKVGGMGTVKPLNTDAWSLPRHYTVPGRLVKAGRAVIAMRIVDQAGQGGPWGGQPSDMFLVPAKAKSDLQSRISLAGKWRFKVALELPRKPGNPMSPNTASVLYNGMINGLIPYGIKGAIWYQGESNANNAYAYRVRFPAMIQDWRTRWNQGEFPFLWVQLANFRQAPVQPENTSWPVVRESQNLTLALPNTGTALAIDIGNAKDIHPKNKQEVGRRLALAARSVAYGESLVYAGPTYQSMTVEGDAIRLHFSHLGGGLEARGGDLKQFAIAGADRKFFWAKAVIDGDSVVVRADGVAAPVAVRYAWAGNPAGCNLYSKEGLPANPFRTDTWPVVTQPRATPAK